MFDSNQAHTYFMDRIKPSFAGEEIPFQVQMPLSPGKAIIRIYDEAVGNRGVDQETSFKVGKIAKKGLKRYLSALDRNDINLKVFVEFAERFCFNAGILPTNTGSQRYCSNDPAKTFKLLYLPILQDPASGRAASTPARVDRFTKIFEASKEKLIDKTVPERMCIMCHEYSHIYMNVVADDELEADLNGLMIYLSLGYPRIEAIETYTSTFFENASDENAFKRLPHIEQFVDSFYDTNKSKKITA